MAENAKNVKSLASDILRCTQKKLAAELPDLLPAIYFLKGEPCKHPGPMFTDGEILYYHPETVLQDFAERKNSIAEQLLHIIAHGLLGHIVKRQEEDGGIFDAAADCKVYHFLADAAEKYFKPRTLPPETRALLTLQKNQSLENLCRTPERDSDAAELIRLSQPFESDDHSVWNLTAERGSENGGGTLPLLWDSVRAQVAQNLQNSGKGELAGDLQMSCDNVAESTVSYSEFLRRFCTFGECMAVDPDSINRIWYQQGLDLLGDCPIIEPEELREDAIATDIAIALDTSGSCCGEIMKQFVSELLAILRDAHGPRVELTLIQCDSAIQNVCTLTREDDAERIANSFSFSGCGGTDFCPVFDYVTQQRASTDGKNFRALLYLSDGIGDFPEKKPDYPTAFLFPQYPEDSGISPLDYAWIPDWVTKVTILDDRLHIEEADENEGETA